MTAAQKAALAHFESYYVALGAALDDLDAERIDALVNERRVALDRLVAAFANEYLPESVRLHIEGSEAFIHGRLVAFHDSLLIGMAAERRFAFAAERYQEASR